MSNHIHGIIAMVVGAPLAGARNETGGDGRDKGSGDRKGLRATARVAPTTVGDIVGTYKSLLPPLGGLLIVIQQLIETFS
jgi:hypothetical protein